MSRRLDLAQAQSIVGAAIAHAASIGVPMTVTVVDVTGAAVALGRMDKAPPATSAIAQAKARCSASFFIPTSFLEAGSRDMPSLASLPQVVAAGGGVPILSEGECIGAVGASGGSAAQDEEVAQAGLAAFA